jgi:hypothetical protein
MATGSFALKEHVAAPIVGWIGVRRRFSNNPSIYRILSDEENI